MGTFKWPGCADLQETDFQAEVVADKTSGLEEELKMDFAPDGRLFYVERKGNVKIYDPGTGKNTVAAVLPVYATSEFGVEGIALDPGFNVNQWVYLYYSPPTPAEQRLSRFTLKGNALDLASEVRVLTLPILRNCCHTGGDMGFDSQGNLYLSTGDNIVPFSDRYIPIDDRPGRQSQDDLGHAGNTNYLSGKILRIHPTPDGRYTIPKGNLFPEGLAGTRPEIYTMGHRNPYSLSVDKVTGWVTEADVGNDAGIDSVTRGPAGHDEWNLVKQAGNFGWPMFVGANLPYRNYNYDTKQPGAYFDPLHPINDSRNNTGLRELPPAVPAILPYGRANHTEKRWPGFTGGFAAIAGPIYHYDGANPSKSKFPPHFNNIWFIGEFKSDWLKAIILDDQGTQVKDVQPVFTSQNISGPINLKFAPDGSLYVFNYGKSWNGRDNTTTIMRIRYSGSCLPETIPTALSVPSRRAQPSLLYVRASLLIKVPLGAKNADLTDLQGRILFHFPSAIVEGRKELRLPDGARQGLSAVHWHY